MFIAIFRIFVCSANNFPYPKNSNEGIKEKTIFYHGLFLVEGLQQLKYILCPLLNEACEVKINNIYTYMYIKHTIIDIQILIVLLNCVFIVNIMIVV